MHSVHHLEMIAALAKHRHFGRAAESLGISQPGLTKGLLYVERELGVKLFDRASPIRPTAFGEIVLARSEEIITGFAEIRREIDQAKRETTHELVVSTGVHAAETSGLEAMAEFSAAFPAIRCSISVKSWEEVEADVLAQRCDLGFASIKSACESPNLETEEVRRSRKEVFCRPGHPMAGRETVTFEELTSYPWVAPGTVVEDLPFRDGAEGAFGKVAGAKGQVKPRLQASTLETIKQIVGRSDAISAAPLVLIKDDVAAGRLRILTPVDAELHDRLGFLWRKGRALSPAAKEFMRIVRAIEAKLGP